MKDIIFEWEREIHLHVKESLEPGVETLVGNLFPEFPQLSFIDRITFHIPLPCKWTEQLSCKLLWLLHSCHYTNFTQALQNSKLTKANNIQSKPNTFTYLQVRRKEICIELPIHSQNRARGSKPSVEAVISSKRFSTAAHPAPPSVLLINFSPFKAWAAADLDLSRRPGGGLFENEANRFISWETCLILAEAVLTTLEADLLSGPLASNVISGSSLTPWEGLTLCTATKSFRTSRVISTYCSSLDVVVSGMLNRALFFPGLLFRGPLNGPL